MKETSGNKFIKCTRCHHFKYITKNVYMCDKFITEGELDDFEGCDEGAIRGL